MAGEQSKKEQSKQRKGLEHHAKWQREKVINFKLVIENTRTESGTVTFAGVKMMNWNWRQRWLKVELLSREGKLEILRDIK